MAEKEFSIDPEVAKTEEVLRPVEQLRTAEAINNTFQQLHEITPKTIDEMEETLDTCAAPAELKDALFERFYLIQEFITALEEEEMDGTRALVESYELPASSAQANRITSRITPLCIESSVPHQLTNYMYTSPHMLYSEDQNFGSSIQGFYIPHRRYTLDYENFDIPTIIISQSSTSPDVLTHERGHLETVLLDEAGLLPHVVSQREAYRAAQELLSMYEDSQELAFASKEWETVVSYANSALASEVMSEWSSASTTNDFENFVDYVLQEDGKTYNFLKAHLNLTGQEEIYKFVWQTYSMQAKHNIEPAIQLRKFYKENPAFNSRVRTLGTALKTMPVGDWKEFLEDEDTDFIGEANAYLQLKRDVQNSRWSDGPDVAEDLLVYKGQIYDTEIAFGKHLAAEKTANEAANNKLRELDDEIAANSNVIYAKKIKSLSEEVSQ